MRTRREALAAGPVAAATLVAVLAMGSGAASAETPATIPQPLAELGVTGQAAPVASISAEQAVAAARAAVGDAAEHAAIRTSLVSATDPALAHTAAAMISRPVWIVELTGLSIAVPGAARLDGTSAPGHVIHRGYVYVDANTGDHVATIWLQ